MPESAIRRRFVRGWRNFERVYRGTGARLSEPGPRQRRLNESMATDVLRDVLEATGYLAGGEPARGVLLGDEARAGCRTRRFAPDALWRSDSALTVHFKYEPDVPDDDRVAEWRREVWNQGFAPLLWVVSPDRIDLYNGFGRPLASGDADAHRVRWFRTVEGALDELDAFAGRLAMETGRFWQRADIDRRTSVDRQLLSDLAALERDLVTAGLDRAAAQGLIGRSIFAQFLVDREIITAERLESEYGRGALSAVLRDRRATERLFDWLRDTFNGDVFPSGGAPLPDAEHLGRVADFLDAVDPESGQGTLFPYQFDVIPVELISSIYEQFAHAEPSTPGRESETDVFYTRLSLVSLVLDEVTDGLTGTETVLDLTCGSGVFLVEALRRLVALRANGNPPSRDLIRSTLHRQIHGVDVSEAAVRVAAFSLYLAALELDPDPQPPEALRFEPLIGRTLHVGDAWEIDTVPTARPVLTEGAAPKKLHLDPGPTRSAAPPAATSTEDEAPRKFDVIVGNPPWSYRGQASTAARRHRAGRNGPRAPRGESLDFVRRAMDFASDATRFGLVLSAVQFFSRSGTGASAVKQLIDKLSPVTLVNLSNQSDWLFSRGSMPALVLLAGHRAPRRDTITAVQVPWSPVGARSHTFEIAPGDVIDLPLADWRRNPALLKGALLGGRRDLALLDRLSTSHDALSDRLDALDAPLRTGLILGNRSRDAGCLRGLPLLTARDLQPFSFLEPLGIFDEPQAERPREQGTYQEPLLVIKEFLRRVPRPIVAVLDHDTVFTDAFFGAAFPPSRREAARLLAAILSSSLASWFFLMTASTFGLSMRRIKCRDIEHLPVPDVDVSLRAEAGRDLTRLAHDLQRQPPTSVDDPRWRTLDEAVFDLYGLDDAECVVVRDGHFRASWHWKDGRERSVDAAVPDPHLLNYARAFLSVMDGWLSARKRRRMRAEVFDLPERAPLRVVRFVLEEGYAPSTAEVVTPDGSARAVLDRLGRRLNVPLATSLSGQRELRVHGRGEVVVIKPAARRHWMGVSALDDADAVVAESFAGPACRFGHLGSSISENSLAGNASPCKIDEPVAADAWAAGAGTDEDVRSSGKVGAGAEPREDVEVDCRVKQERVADTD